MKTNHTPGPWHVGMNPGPIVYGTQGEQVASLFVPMVPVEDNKANARLIAAVPDMLEAGRNLFMLCLQSERYRDDPEFRDCVDVLIDVHRQATTQNEVIAT